MSNLFESVLGLWGASDDSERVAFDMVAEADGHGLMLRVTDIEALLDAIKNEAPDLIEIYLNQEEILETLDLLWDSKTIKAKPKIVWPFSFRFRKPEIKLEIK